MKHKGYNYVHLYSGLIIGSILTTITFFFMFSINLEAVDHIVKILSYPFIAGSAVVALLKYKQDEAWNKKHLAFEKISSYIKELEEFRLEIDRIVVRNKLIINENDEVISFTDRRRVSDSLKPEEVHSWVCQDYNVSNSKDMCSLTEDGAVIIRNILSIINIYELIAIGIKDKILDKELIRESLEHVIVKNYAFFEDYIVHRREKHDDKTLASEWEKLYKEFKN